MIRQEREGNLAPCVSHLFSALYQLLDSLQTIILHLIISEQILYFLRDRFRKGIKVKQLISIGAILNLLLIVWRLPIRPEVLRVELLSLCGRP